MSESAFVITEWQSCKRYQLQLKAPGILACDPGGHPWCFLSPIYIWWMCKPIIKSCKISLLNTSGITPSLFSIVSVQATTSSSKLGNAPNPVHSQFFNQCNFAKHLILSLSCLKLALPVSLGVSPIAWLWVSPAILLTLVSVLGSQLAGHTGLLPTRLFFLCALLPQGLCTCDSFTQEASQCILLPLPICPPGLNWKVMSTGKPSQMFPAQKSLMRSSLSVTCSQCTFPLLHFWQLETLYRLFSFQTVSFGYLCILRANSIWHILSSINVNP